MSVTVIFKTISILATQVYLIEGENTALMFVAHAHATAAEDLKGILVPRDLRRWSAQDVHHECHLKDSWLINKQLLIKQKFNISSGENISMTPIYYYQKVLFTLCYHYSSEKSIYYTELHYTLLYNIIY